MKYHLLNQVRVVPRWHDRKLLIRADGMNSLKAGGNIVWICKKTPSGLIKYPGYEEPRYLHSMQARELPTQVVHGRSGDYLTYVVPMDSLQTVTEHANESKEILTAIRSFGW